MIQEKVKTLEEIEELVLKLKQEGRKIVHCHGVFDVVHYGHVRHFLSAKEQGDILIVTITPDRFIQKGPGRPFFTEEIRLEYLAAIQCIDYVVLNKWDTAIETIKIIRPDFYVKGKEVLNNKDIDKIEQEGKSGSNLSLEIDALKSVGGKLFLTEEVTFSASRIINQITSSISEETKEFLRNLKTKFDINKINEILDSLKDLKVLIIGDYILDEYIYGLSLEKTGKNPLIAYKRMNSETFLGGVFAVANHVSGFAKEVSLITCVGDDCFSYIDCNLNKGVEKNIFVQHGSKTLIKTRYLDNYTNAKLFEIYNTDELKIDEDHEERVLKYLETNLHRFDLIIVTDFGHGMLSFKIKEYLVNSDKFLAINSQLNAGNLGYNFITKYNRANFVSLSERELRLPFQEKTSDIKIPIIKLSQRLNLEKINITLGKSGSIYFQNGNYYNAPSFTTSPIDTVGAGDAVLSLTSLLSYKNIDPEIIPFLGNSIGALAVKIVGNKRPVDLQELKKFVAYVLK